MLLTLLLQKDLRRARRNPWPYIIFLALPLCITALIGLAFGRSSSGGGLARIRMAIVDEDDSLLSQLLRGGMNQGDFRQHIDLSFLERDAALRQIDDDKISAVLVIPKGFTRGYLSGETGIRLELIKNPAQSVYPATVEALLEVAVAGLNAISRNLHADLPEWKALIEKDGPPDLKRMGELMTRMGDRFEKVGHYLFPPLAGYTRETTRNPVKESTAGNIFAFLLPGLAAMFLLYLADNAVRDIYREVEAGTLDRFRTMRPGLLDWVVSKVTLGIVIVVLGGLVLFAGGAGIFSIHWRGPLVIAAMVVVYALFASGLMALIASLSRHARRADALTNIVILTMSFAGGSCFPARDLPPVLRDQISPLMPNYWFIEALRAVQFGGSTAPWFGAALRLLVLGLIMSLAAAWILRRALNRGVRA